MFSKFLAMAIDSKKTLNYTSFYNSPPEFCNHHDDCENIGWREVFNCLNNVNSYGYRSDEFKKNHDGKHLLFAGCSYTWGLGLFKKEIWANIVYEKISSQEKCSGYFNLGVPGSCVSNQVYDIFQYCNRFGNPDVIFYCMPALHRGFDPDAISAIKKTHFPPFHTNYNEILDKSDNSEYNVSYSEMINYISYFSLYQYCKSNNIKLYSFSWEEVVDTESYTKEVPFEERVKRMKSEDGSGIKQAQYGDPKNPFESFGVVKKLETFYIWKREDLLNYCADFIKRYSGEHKKFLQVARDGDHVGIAPHSFWADFILKKYYLDNSINNML